MPNKKLPQISNKDEEEASSNVLDSRWSRIKENLYMGIILTLESEANAYVFPFVLHFLMWLQIVFVPFSKILEKIWGKSDFAETLKTICKILQIQPLLQNGGFIYYCIALYLTFGLIFGGCCTLYLSGSPRMWKTIKSERIFQINKFVILLLTKIFILPILMILVQTFNCSFDKEGLLFMTSYPEIQCFQRWHLINFVITIFFFLAFIIYGFLVSLLYFETDADRRLVQGSFPSFGRIYIFLFLIKYSLIDLLSSHAYEEYIALIFLLFSNVVIFNAFYRHCPFYDKGLKTLTKIMVAISLWTILCAFFAKTLDRVVYDDPLTLWVLGVPLITAIVFLSSEKNFKLLLTDLNQISDCETICRQQTYLFKLWQNRDSNEYNSVIIDGFLTIHQQTCDVIDCPIKKIVSDPDSNKMSLKNPELLLSFIEFNFKTSIARFPSNVQLRVFYILFLERFPHRSHDILSQLNTIENLKNNLYDDFFVFKYKLKISGKLKSFAKNAAFTKRPENNRSKEQKLIEEFMDTMELCCKAYMRFWTHLAEDNPSHIQLKILGHHIQQSCADIESIWNKLEAISLQDRIKIMMLYGNFQKHIMNKQTGGDAILIKARELLTIQKIEKEGNHLIDLDLGLTNLSNASILISGHPDNMGEILKANGAASILFGYGAKELAGSNVSLIIPKTFNMHHNAYIEKAAKNKSLDYMSREKFVFGLSKQGYLIPLQIYVKPICTPFMCFIGMMKPARQMHLTGFVLTDYKGRIEAVSTNMISLYNIDYKSIMSQPFINNYFPGLFEERDYYVMRGEALLPQKYLLINDPSNNQSFGTYKLMLEVTKHQHWKMIKEYYIFKFMKIEDRELSKSISKNKIPSYENPNVGFEFWIDDKNFEVFGRNYNLTSENSNEEQEERMEMEVSELENNNHRLNSSPNAKNKKKLPRRPRLISDNINMMDSTEWHKDIKIFKLDRGKIVEPENVTDEDEDRLAMIKNAASENAQLRIKREYDEESVSIIQNIKSNKLMKQFITAKKLPSILILAFFIITIMLLLSIASTTFEYVSNNGVIYKAVQYHDLYSHYSLQLYEFQNIADAIIQLIAQPAKLANETMSEFDLKNYINFSVLSAENLNDIIIKHLENLNDAVLYNNTIYSNLTIYNSNTLFNSTEYSNSIKQILAQSSLVKDTPLKSIVFKPNTSTYFSIVNILNDGWTQIFQKGQLILQACNLMLENENSAIITQILTSLFLVLSFVLFWLVKKFGNRHATRNLNLFLDIAQNEVKRYISNCEFFITNIHTNSLDQANFEDLVALKDFQDYDNLPVRRGRRDASKKLSISLTFYLKFLLIVLSAIGLNVWFYFEHSTSIHNIIELSTEIQNIATLGPYYHFISNMMLLKIIDVQTKVNPPLNYTLDESFLSNAFKLDSEFYEAQLENTRLHSEEYQLLMNSLMTGNFCDLLNMTQTFAPQYYDLGDTQLCTYKVQTDGLDLYLKQGFRSGFAHYQDSLYEMFDQYKSYVFNLNSLDSVKPFANPRCKQAKNYTNFCVFGFENIQKNYRYQNMYLNFFTKKMLSMYNNDFKSFVIGSLKARETLIFCLFVAILLVGYLIIYFKTFWDIRKDYFIFQRMILMVPLDSIKYSLYNKDFFKSYLKRLLK